MGQLASSQQNSTSKTSLKRNSKSNNSQRNAFNRENPKNNSKKSLRGSKAKRSGKQIQDDIQLRVDQIRTQMLTHGLTNETIERFLATLSKYSQELGSIKKKTEDIQNLQKDISTLTQQLIEEKDQQRTSTNLVAKRSENKKGQTSLSEIENRFDALDVDMVTAIEHRDSKGLARVSKSIKSLMTDLQMLDLPNGSKNSLEKKMKRTYQKAEEKRNEILNGANSPDTYKEERIMTELKDIERSLSTIDIPENYVVDLNLIKTFKETLSNCEDRLKTVEEMSREIQNKKSSLINEIKTLQMLVDKSEMMSKMQIAQNDIHNFKANLMKRNELKPEEYQRYKKYIRQQEQYIKKILDTDQEVSMKKKSTLSEIEDSLAFLNQMMESNQANTNNQYQQEESVNFRSGLNLSQLLSNIVKDYERFHNSFDLTKLNNQFEAKQQLERLKSYIQNDLNQISGSLNKASSNVSRDSTDFVRSVDQFQIVNAKFDELPSVNQLSNYTRQNYDSIDQLENMNKEVQVILQQIDQYSFEKDSQDYDNLKDQLMAHKRTLGTFSSYRNDNIKRSCAEINNMIEDALCRLEAKSYYKRYSNGSIKGFTQNRHSTTDNTLNTVMGIGTNVNELRSVIDSGKSLTEEDHNKHKSTLINYINYLESLISNNYNVSRSKSEILNDAKILLKKLEHLNQNKLQSYDNEKQLTNEINSLSEKVSRFSGTFKNVLYTKLEKDLNKCLSNVDSNIEDEDTATRLKSNIQKNLKILEQKSSKDSHYGEVDQNNIEERKNLHAIKTDFENIKYEINTKNPMSKKELETLKSRLDLARITLKNFKTKNELVIEDKKRVQNEISEYLNYVTNQLSLVENRSNVTSQPDIQNHEHPYAAAIIEELKNVEENITKMRPKVENFSGSETSDRFFELDESLIQNTLRLDKLKFTRGDEYHTRKIKMLKEINLLTEMLDDRVKETELVEEMEKSTKEIMMKIDALSRNFSNEEFDSLDEQLTNIRINLMKPKLNSELESLSKACLQNVFECSKRLKQADQDRQQHRSLQGTLV